MVPLNTHSFLTSFLLQISNMSEVVTTTQLVDTPVIKTPDSTTPVVSPISDQQLQNNFIPTGITVIIPTNLAKINSEALFGVNVDGFIPPLNNTVNLPVLWKNLFPVQLTQAGSATPGLRVIYEYVQIPVQFKYLSYRYLSGNVGVGIRISSQTGQVGNFYITQARTASRWYYGATDLYNGLRFCNASINTLDYAPASFAIGDLSLNRNISITTVRTNTNVVQDHAQKLLDLQRFGNGSADFRNYLNFVNQQSEDWLLFQPVMNLSGAAASEIFMTFFFDFSTVSFSTPMYPIIPIYPDLYETQILLYTQTFAGQFGKDKFIDWVWYPRDAGALLAKDYPVERFSDLAIAGSFDINGSEHSNKYLNSLKPAKASSDHTLFPLFKHLSRLYRPSHNVSTTTTTKPTQ